MIATPTEATATRALRRGLSILQGTPIFSSSVDPLVGALSARARVGRHVVVLIRDDARDYVVKMALNGGSDEQRFLQREQQFYVDCREEGRWNQLSCIMPRAIHVDERQAFILFEGDEPSRPFERLCINPRGPILGAAENLGSALALVHAQEPKATEGRSPVFVPDLLEEKERLGDEQVLHAMLLAQPFVVNAVAEIAEAGEVATLIHGDIKGDNVLVRPDGSVLLIDWELAGAGDPGWDLGGGLLAVLRQCLVPSALHASTASELRSDALHALAQLPERARRFWESYWRTSRHTSTRWGGEAQIARRAVLSAVARSVDDALEAARGGRMRNLDSVLVRIACNVAERPGPSSQALFGLACA